MERVPVEKVCQLFLRTRARTFSAEANAGSAKKMCQNNNIEIFRVSKKREKALERFPTAWNHAVDKKSLQFKKLEQVLIEKVYQLFRNLL